jgi:PKD repeat protein
MNRSSRTHFFFPVVRAAVLLFLTVGSLWSNSNMVTNGAFNDGLAGWTFSGNVSASSDPSLTTSLTKDSTVQSVLFQTVQQQGSPINLSIDFYYAVLSDVVPSGTFTDTAYFSIYESTNALTLRPDLGQFDSVSSVFDATFNGFTNVVAGVSIQPSSRGPDWWTVSLTNYTPTHNFVAPTLEVYNFNGIANDSTALMTGVVMDSVPEPGTTVLLGLAFVLALAVRRIRHLPILCLAVLSAAAPLRAQPVVALGSRVRVATSNESSALDRATRVITQTADITLTNTGDRPVKPPLRVRIALAGTGDLSRVTLGDVIAGNADDARPYRDLSALLPPAGLAPGASVQFTLCIVRPFDLPVSYQLESQGVFNRDPSVAFEAPLAAVAGEEVAFDAGASDDGEGGTQISYVWNFSDGGASDAVAPKRVFAKPGRYDVTLTVTDGEGAKSVLRKTIAVLPSANFVVARTRTLDASGQPLGAVAVLQCAGTEVTESISDTAAGFASLGGEPGEYIWRFSREGYLPVWRKASLSPRQILFLPSPWLVRENAKDKPVSPLRELVLGGTNQPATITFKAGSFAAEGAAGFTPIGPQALPLPLPAGWSPLGSFHLALPSATSQAGAVAWIPSDKLGSDDVLAMLRYDANALQWTVVAMPVPVASPSAVINEAGNYTLVVADKGARAPPMAQVGVALPAATDIAFDASTISATGSVDPSKITASREAAAMTAAGRVIFTGASDLPSGIYFRTEIEEVYNLANGKTQHSPVYDTSFFAYQRPGDADAKTLHAAFPLRPTRIISPEQIDTAKIEADILTGDSYAASLFDQTGGRIAAENLAVSAESGDLLGRSLAELRLLDIKGFEVPLAGRTGVAAFQLAVGNLADGRGLNVELSGVAPNKDFVVARYVAKDDEEGLEPVERLRSDANGDASSIETAEGVRLPGVTGPGQYLVVAVDGPQAVVSGVARNLAGDAVAGLAVRITSLPWLTFSAAGGAYKLVAPQGATSTAAVTDMSDGNSGSSEIVVEGGANNAQADVRAVTTAPRVANVSPVDGAQKVRAATPVKIWFSEPIDPATFGPDAITVTNPLGVLIQGSLSLNPAGTESTFLPTNPLEHVATYTIELSAGIKDRQGLPLEGVRLFSFSVVPFFERTPGAQLVIYEPGAENIPQNVRSMLVGYNSAEGSGHVVAYGSAGTADPEVSVILVNQNTGETATVLSKLDGSFASFINAAEEDFIEAVFVNGNGTRVTIPATKQLYDNGSIGLYKYGGILEAESDGGPVEVLIEPQAIKERTVFKLNVFSVLQLAELLDGLAPAGGEKILGGLKIEATGDTLSERPRVTFPVDSSDLSLSSSVDLAGAAFVVASMRDFEGKRLFVIEDSLDYDGARLVSNTSQPFPGITSNETSVVISLDSRQPQASKQRSAATAVRVPMNTPPEGPWMGKALVRGNVKTDSDSPVSGAFVMVRYDDDSTGFIIYPAGSVVAATEDNGFFTTIVPGSARPSDGRAPLVAALSSRFPNQVALARTSNAFPSDPNAPWVGYPRFAAPKVAEGVFDGAEVMAPRISASLPRESPPAGSDFDISILATSGFFAVPNIKVRVVQTTPPVSPGQEVVCAEKFSDAAGDVSRTAIWQINSPIATQVDLEVTATDAQGNLAVLPITVLVGETAPPSDPGDIRGPKLVTSFPANDEMNHPLSDAVRLVFDEPLDPSALLPSAVSMVPDPGYRRMELRNSNRELWLICPELQPGTMYQVLLSPQIKDTKGNPHDQNPGTQPLDLGIVRFRTKAEAVYRPTGIGNAGGVAGSKDFRAVIDRSPASGQGALIIYGKSGELLSETALPDFPRDLAVISPYDYVKRVAEGLETRTNAQLIAVVGGSAGLDEISAQPGQWIRVFDVTDPSRPETIVSRILTPSSSSAATRVVWSAPHLGVLQFVGQGSADAVLLLNLQWLVLSSGTNPLIGPKGPFFGRDVNGDGDFADLNFGDKLPYSSDSQELVGVFNAGLVASYMDSMETGPIYDFSMVSRGSLIGAVGRVENKEGLDGNGYYTTLAQAGQPLGGDRPRVMFPKVPQRVTLVLGAKVALDGGVAVRNLAVVSGGEANTVSFIDITDPLRPAIIGKVVFPASAGAPRSVSLVSDHVLAVACTDDLYFLRLENVAGTQVADQNNQVVIRRISGAGTGLRSFYADADGNFASARGNQAVIYDADRSYSVRLSRPGTLQTPGPKVPGNRDQDPKACILPVNLDFDHVPPDAPLVTQKGEPVLYPLDQSLDPRDAHDDELIAVTLPAIDRFKNAWSIRISVDTAPVENQSIPKVKNPLYVASGAEPEYLARRLSLLQENETQPGAVQIAEVALPRDSTSSQRSQLVYESFDPADPNSSGSKSKLFEALLQGDARIFIDSSIPSPRVGVKVEVLDPGGNIIVQDMVAFAAVEARITCIWSEQFPQGKKSNSLPGNASSARGDGGPYNFILTGNRGDNVTYVGGEFSLIPDLQAFRKLFTFRLASPQWEYSLLELFKGNEPVHIYGNSSNSIPDKSFSIVADDSLIPRSASASAVLLNLLTEGYFSDKDVKAEPPFLERFIVGGIDQNEDGNLTAEEAYLGLSAKDQDHRNGAGFQRGQLITGGAPWILGDKANGISRYSRPHLKVVPRSLAVAQSAEIGSIGFIGYLLKIVADIALSIPSIINDFSLADAIAPKHLALYISGVLPALTEPDLIYHQKFPDYERAPRATVEVEDIHPSVANDVHRPWFGKKEYSMLCGPLWDHHIGKFDQEGFQKVPVYEYSPSSSVAHDVARTTQFRYTIIEALTVDAEFCRAMRLAAKQADDRGDEFFEVPFARKTEQLFATGQYAPESLSDYHPDLHMGIGGFNLGDIDCIVRFKIVDSAATFNGTVVGMNDDVSIRADTAGPAGNNITLAFNGEDDIATGLALWNSENPSNKASLTYGTGSQKPAKGQTISLSGGRMKAPYEAKVTECRVVRVTGTVRLLDLYDWDMAVNPGLAFSAAGEIGRPFATQVRMTEDIHFADLFQFHPPFGNFSEIIYDIK